MIPQIEFHHEGRVLVATRGGMQLARMRRVHAMLYRVDMVGIVYDLIAECEGCVQQQFRSLVYAWEQNNRWPLGAVDLS